VLALYAGGRHFCIGAALARMELEALVSILTEEWASESLLNKGVYYGNGVSIHFQGGLCNLVLSSQY
jgi:cytochrome P450